MAALSSQDMRNIASSGPYAGASRPDIFLKKIADGKTFRVISEGGKEIFGVEYNKKSEVLTYYEKSDSKKNIKEIKRSQIFKDGDFGGGKGSGGGAADTALTESLQCYYCAYVFNSAKKEVKTVSDAQLKSTAQYAHTDRSLDVCLSKGPKDWIETDVYIKTANKLFKEVKFNSSPVHFHRGSPFMKNVYAAYATCQANDLASDAPQAPGSFNDDKWNPGDIWASTFSVDDKPLEKFTKDWTTLNSEVLKLAGNGSKRGVKLLGISLKRVTGNATITEYQGPVQLKQKKNYTWDSWLFGSNGDFFSSNDIYVTISGIRMQMRSFSGSWQGEVKGQSAAGGKIGGGNVNFYTTKHFRQSIFGTKTGKTAYSQFITESNTPSFNYEDKLYEMYAEVNEKGLSNDATMSKAEFSSKLKTKLLEGGEFRDSKLMCLMFLTAAYNKHSNDAKRNAFATDLFRYASSDTDQSSYFVKIS